MLLFAKLPHRIKYLLLLSLKSLKYILSSTLFFIATVSIVFRQLKKGWNFFHSLPSLEPSLQWSEPAAYLEWAATHPPTPIAPCASPGVHTCAFLSLFLPLLFSEIKTLHIEAHCRSLERKESVCWTILRERTAKTVERRSCTLSSPLPFFSFSLSFLLNGLYYLATLPWEESTECNQSKERALLINWRAIMFGCLLFTVTSNHHKTVITDIAIVVTSCPLMTVHSSSSFFLFLSFFQQNQWD